MTRRKYKMSEIRKLGVKNAENGNIKKAEMLLKLAIESGDCNALNDLGVVKEREGKYGEAHSLYLQAAALGNIDALVNYAKDTLYHRIFNWDGFDKKALMFLKRAAELGHPAGYGLIFEHFISKRNDISLEDKIDFLKEGFEYEKKWNNCVSCAMQLGYLLETNDRDEEAIPYYKNAAKKSSDIANFNLAFAYKRKGDMKKFITFMKKAADLNYPDAYAELARVYIDGDDNIKSDKKTARVYLEESLSLNSLRGRLIYIDCGLCHDYEFSKDEMENQVKLFLSQKYHEDFMDYYNTLKNQFPNDLDWDALECKTYSDDDYMVKENEEA